MAKSKKGTQVDEPDERCAAGCFDVLTRVIGKTEDARVLSSD